MIILRVKAKIIQINLILSESEKNNYDPNKSKINLKENNMRLYESNQNIVSLQK